MTRIFRRTGMIFHCVLVGGTAAVVATPPAEGMMLVAPLYSVSSAHTLGWVLPTGARPVAAGPYEGSFVVYGTRSALIATALAHGTLLLNSRLSECGSPTRTIA
ncbi:MAG: hypothetical protein MEP44_03215 [Blastomonas sp.]|nr:hypothetical protein [Blastomonas sp.]